MLTCGHDTAPSLAVGGQEGTGAVVDLPCLRLDHEGVQSVGYQKKSPLGANGHVPS